VEAKHKRKKHWTEGRRNIKYMRQDAQMTVAVYESKSTHDSTNVTERLQK